jgi:hypothetical protein
LATKNFPSEKLQLSATIFFILPQIPNNYSNLLGTFEIGSKVA